MEDPAMTPEAVPAPPAPAPKKAKATRAAVEVRRGPRDVREAAFVDFLTHQGEVPGGDKIVRVGYVFFAGCAGLVVLLALIGSFTA